VRLSPPSGARSSKAHLDVTTQPPDLLPRFRRWAIWAIAIGAILYVVGTVWAGFSEVGAELLNFAWWLYIPVLLLTLVNYGLRWVKWRYLLGRLGLSLPWREDATLFIAGLAMVISPGKAGELLKPYVVSKRTGVNLATTIPALLTERITDGIAMLALAAISVSTYAADRVAWVAVPSALLGAALIVLMSEPLSMGSVDLLARLPGVGRLAPKIRELLMALRICLSPGALLWTVLLSLVAWFAECVGFWLIFIGMGVEASLDASTFLYAFSTIAGGAMPGGLGVADGALAGGAVTLLGVSEAVAVTSALLVRVATLWFGVLLGAVALLRFESLLGGGPAADSAETPPEGA
jgi:uncharacterized membrane protein YbhN (UPF0104 family)